MTDKLSVETSPLVSFLMTLRKIDKSGLTARDILLLYIMRTYPGINGWDAGKKAGVKERSSVQFCLGRLIKRKFIEDRRKDDGKSIPNRWYVLPDGVAFLDDIIPKQ